MNILTLFGLAWFGLNIALLCCSVADPDGSEEDCTRERINQCHAPGADATCALQSASFSIVSGDGEDG